MLRQMFHLSGGDPIDGGMCVLPDRPERQDAAPGVDHEQAEACRRAIAPFAELERAPEHIHTYRVTPLGLWNARAAGHDAEQVVDALAVRHDPGPALAEG
jgi:hypothetical protein